MAFRTKPASAPCAGCVSVRPNPNPGTPPVETKACESPHRSRLGRQHRQNACNWARCVRRFSFVFNVNGGATQARIQVRPINQQHRAGAHPNEQPTQVLIVLHPLGVKVNGVRPHLFTNPATHRNKLHGVDLSDDDWNNWGLTPFGDNSGSDPIYSVAAVPDTL